MKAADGNRAWASVRAGRGGKHLPYSLCSTSTREENTTNSFIPLQSLLHYNDPPFNCTGVFYWRYWYTPCRKPVLLIQAIFLKNKHTMQNKLAPMKSHRQLPKCCPLCLMFSAWGFPISFSARVFHHTRMDRLRRHSGLQSAWYWGLYL